MIKEFIKKMRLISVVTLMIFISCEIKDPIEYQGTERSPYVMGILNPDSVLSINVGLTSLLNADENRDMQHIGIENATVEVFENGLTLGQLKHIDNGKYLLENYYPKTGTHYSVEVAIPNYQRLSSSTSIPHAIDADGCYFPFNFDIVADGIGAKLMLHDTKNEHNTYWLNILLKNYWTIDDEGNRDSTIISYKEASVKTQSSLVDDFNTDNEQGFRSHYGMARVEDTAFAGGSTELNFYGITGDFRTSYTEIPAYDENQGVYIRVISTSLEYDRFLKTNYVRHINNPPSNTGDGAIPYPFPNNTVVYSNINNGTGIFAGFSQAYIPSHFTTCP